MRLKTGGSENGEINEMKLRINWENVLYYCVEATDNSFNAHNNTIIVCRTFFAF